MPLKLGTHLSKIVCFLLNRQLSVSVYNCLSDRSWSNDWLLPKGQADKPASNQLLQPMAASTDQCILTRAHPIRIQRHSERNHCFNIICIDAVICQGFFVQSDGCTQLYSTLSPLRVAVGRIYSISFKYILQSPQSI